jgi:hypothetical protein
MALWYYCLIQKGGFMAKVKIVTDEGTKIEVEGTPEEVAKIMNVYQRGGASKKSIEPSGGTSKKDKKFLKKNSTSSTMTDSIRELIVNGFFDKPRGLAEIKTKLEEEGVFIAITSLSERVLFLTKKRDLRRTKDSKTSRWVYVKR